jgi:hypothetical protein
MAIAANNTARGDLLVIATLSLRMLPASLFSYQSSVFYRARQEPFLDHARKRLLTTFSPN